MQTKLVYIKPIGRTGILTGYYYDSCIVKLISGKTKRYKEKELKILG